MNEQLITIALLLMIAAMLGIVVLLIKTMAAVYEVGTDMLKSQLALMQGLTLHDRVIRRRIGQVKTRLADEEAEDQRAKARARRKGVRS